MTLFVLFLGEHIVLHMILILHRRYGPYGPTLILKMGNYSGNLSRILCAQVVMNAINNAIKMGQVGALQQEH